MWLNQLCVWQCVPPGRQTIKKAFVFLILIFISLSGQIFASYLLQTPENLLPGTALAGLSVFWTSKKTYALNLNHLLTASLNLAHSILSPFGRWSQWNRASFQNTGLSFQLWAADSFPSSLPWITRPPGERRFLLFSCCSLPFSLPSNLSIKVSLGGHWLLIFNFASSLCFPPRSVGMPWLLAYWNLEPLYLYWLIHRGNLYWPTGKKCWAIKLWSLTGAISTNIHRVPLGQTLC